MAYETVLFDVHERICTITLNRPDKLNAWTRQMHFDLKDAMQRAGADPEVRVIILTGAGRGFCAGADLKAISDGRGNVVRAEGCYFWDSAGKRYLDLGGGIAVCALGHANPEITETLVEQSRRLVHVSNLYYHEPQGRLAQRLVGRHDAHGACLQPVLSEHTQRRQTGSSRTSNASRKARSLRPTISSRRVKPISARIFRTSSATKKK